jgi:hypothetical protein
MVLAGGAEVPVPRRVRNGKLREAMPIADESL